MSDVKILRNLFRLAKREFITPNFIRLTLQGDDMKPYEVCTIGVNNKILLPRPGSKEVNLPKFDDETHDWIFPEDHLKPIIRTYTYRGADFEKNQMIVDFVHHGDNGPASAWAINAKLGEEIGVAMKMYKSELYPESDWYFLIGDATAIPVLSAIMESLPNDKKGVALIEVPTKEDEQSLTKPENFEVIWIHNSHPENGSELAEKAKEFEIPEGEKFAYVAAEFSTVKELRNYFRKELAWTKDELYAYSYWKAGVAEDQSASDRQKEKAEN